MGNFASSSATTNSTLPPLQPNMNCETSRFMGYWFVIAVKPTIFEKTCSNAVENYTWLTNPSNILERTTTVTPKPSSYDIDIDFKYNKDTPITSSLQAVPQKGWIQGGDNKTKSGFWKVSPLWPIKMPFLVLEVDEVNYEYTVIGYPSREYCWIMCRTPQMKESTYEMLTKQLIEKHQYSLDGLRRVPQVWTREERTKRGLSYKEIPDDMLEPEIKSG